MGGPPDSFDVLSQEILGRRDELSKQLQKIARFALDNPTTIALDTIASIAKSAQVQPSALIRFAKAFEYDGFSDMQRVFQAHIAERSASYNERVKRELALDDQVSPDSPATLLAQLCSASAASIEQLQSGIEGQQLNQAVEILHRARHIYVIGQRRSFPIAAYLTYTLNRVGSRPHLLDGIGGLLREQAGAMDADDALIAISFHPYAEETREVLEVAQSLQVPSVAITDTRFSPVASLASAALIVHDAELHNVRSLAATFCVAQTLATSLAFIGAEERREGGRKPRRPPQKRKGKRGSAKRG